MRTATPAVRAPPTGGRSGGERVTACELAGWDEAPAGAPGAPLVVEAGAVGRGRAPGRDPPLAVGGAGAPQPRPPSPDPGADQLAELGAAGPTGRRRIGPRTFFVDGRARRIAAQQLG